MDFDTISMFLKYFSRLLMLFLVMPVTNCARGLVAKSQGDDTAYREGRISLDPLTHLDPLGSLAILLCGFGWSKPMPIVYSRMKNLKRGIILVSLAGPLCHFISAILCDLVCEIIYCIPSLQYASFGSSGVSATGCVLIVISLLGQINVCLGVINLLPLYGMDGFNILYQLSGPKFHKWVYDYHREIQTGSLIILLALFFLPDLTRGAVDPLGWLIGWVSYFLSLTVSWIPSVFAR